MVLLIVVVGLSNPLEWSFCILVLDSVCRGATAYNDITTPHTRARKLIHNLPSDGRYLRDLFVTLATQLLKRYLCCHGNSLQPAVISISM